MGLADHAYLDRAKDTKELVCDLLKWSVVIGSMWYDERHQSEIQVNSGILKPEGEYGYQAG